MSVFKCARSKAGNSSLNFVQFWSNFIKNSLQNHNFNAPHCTKFSGAHKQYQDLVLPAIEIARLSLSFPQSLSFWEQNPTETNAFKVNVKRDRSKRASHVQKHRLGTPDVNSFNREYGGVREWERAFVRLGG